MIIDWQKVEDIELKLGINYYVCYWSMDFQRWETSMGYRDNNYTDGKERWELDNIYYDSDNDIIKYVIPLPDVPIEKP